MIKIIKNGTVYNPQFIGRTNIIIGGGKILKVGSYLPNIEGAEIIDASEKVIFPGLIDQHVHITGGGGEGGFITRVPEAQLSSFINAGITTVIGLLGTDSSTRSLENLVAKSRALTSEGITALALTGAYEYPSPTITGSVKKDIVFINDIIGVKIAANDHRDSSISTHELARLGTEARVGGMLSGKSGHVTVHMGSGKNDMQDLLDTLENSNIPISVFRPTHINRKRSLCLKALDYAKMGGYIDITCGIPSEINNSEIIRIAIEKNVDLKHITFSSDGFGSWSSYDDAGNIIKIGVTPIDTLLTTIKDLVISGFKVDEVLPLFTSNLAESLKLNHKGYIVEGMDADLIIMDKDFQLEYVIAKGKWLMKNKKILKYGTYERII